MNWITNFVRPRIKTLLGRNETPENLWRKCSNCGEMVFHRDLEAAELVCPSCDHHMRIGPQARFKALFDGAWEAIPIPEVTADPLKFRDEKRYTDRLREARTKTGETDAMVAARGAIDGLTTVVAVQNFAFMGGSLGMAAGEAFIAGAKAALAARAPYVVFTASGGARMQEGILSLMQMPRTTVMIEVLREARLPYITVLTDPTSGGVTASYAMLGDIQLAEPGAMIAFSGPRVIEQTIRAKLPEGFQRAEYLRDHGMIDMVVHRHQMKATLSRVLHLLMKAKPDIHAKADGPAEALAAPAPAEILPPPEKKTEAPAAAKPEQPGAASEPGAGSP